MSLKSSLKRPQATTKALRKPPKKLLKKKQSRPIITTPKAMTASIFRKKPIAKKQKPVKKLLKKKKTLSLRRGQLLRK
jgi:hypothetical protein